MRTVNGGHTIKAYAAHSLHCRLIIRRICVEVATIDSVDHSRPAAPAEGATPTIGCSPAGSGTCKSPGASIVSLNSTPARSATALPPPRHNNPQHPETAQQLHSIHHCPHYRRLQTILVSLLDHAVQVCVGLTLQAAGRSRLAN